MLLHIPQVLTGAALAQARDALSDAPWRDGRATAGPQAMHVKRNEQLPAGSELSQRLGQQVLRALEAQPLFLSAALPKRIHPPRFNRYAAGAADDAPGGYYGPHVDCAVMHAVTHAAQPGGVQRLRSDVSCTLFLADPQDYDGGELTIEDTFGPRRVKLPAGDLLLYPSGSVHAVAPVTRGARVACFFWVESLVRSDERRRLLYDMDGHLMRLRTALGETDPAVVGLTGTYHNLLRQWADT